MNELELIRDQLRTERSHATEVALACAAEASADGAGSHDLRQARVDFLVCVLTRFEERDQMLAELFRAHLPESGAIRQQLDQTLSRSGTSREALVSLEGALAGRCSWREFADFVQGPWLARRNAIEALQQTHARVPELRAVSFVDADSILEERARYARARAKP